MLRSSLVAACLSGLVLAGGVPTSADAASCVFVGTSEPLSTYDVGSYSAQTVLEIKMVTAGPLAPDTAYNDIRIFKSIVIKDGTNDFRYNGSNANPGLDFVVTTDNSGTPFGFVVDLYPLVKEGSKYYQSDLIFTVNNNGITDTFGNIHGVEMAALLGGNYSMKWTNSCNPDGARRAAAMRILASEQHRYSYR